MNARTDDFAELRRVALKADIERQVRARHERIRLLSEARDAIRKAGIRTNDELLEVLQTVQAAVGPYPIFDTTLHQFNAQLLELVCDYEDALQ